MRLFILIVLNILSILSICSCDNTEYKMQYSIVYNDYKLNEDSIDIVLLGKVNDTLLKSKFLKLDLFRDKLYQNIDINKYGWSCNVLNDPSLKNRYFEYDSFLNDCFLILKQKEREKIKTRKDIVKVWQMLLGSNKMITNEDSILWTLNKTRFFQYLNFSKNTPNKMNFIVDTCEFKMYIKAFDYIDRIKKGESYIYTMKFDTSYTKYGIGLDYNKWIFEIKINSDLTSQIKYFTCPVRL